MAASDDRARARALVEDLLGPSDTVADRAVAVLQAHAAALAWVRDATGHYPAPATVAAELNRVAASLRADDREPMAALGQAALDAVATYRSNAA